MTERSRAGSAVEADAYESTRTTCGATEKLLKNKVLAWAVVILWMGMIFAFSAQAHSGEMTEAYLGDANVSVRKCAHMFEYFCLFVWVRHALSLSGAFWRKNISVWALSFAALYAMTDEFHQYFVPGRSATINDVIVDTTGAALAWLVVAVVIPKVFRASAH